MEGEEAEKRDIIIENVWWWRRVSERRKRGRGR